MKKKILYVLFFLFVISIFYYSHDREGAIKNTFEKTPLDLIETYTENSKEVISTTYYEMNNGTWKTDQHTYQYRLIITGRPNNAAQDITFTVLSNIENISFEQAWKASGASSHIDDYFKTEDAVFVATKTG